MSTVLPESERGCTASPEAIRAPGTSWTASVPVRVVTAVSISVFALMFGVTSFFRRPVADEWFFAASYRRHGLFGFVAHGYRTFTGRLPLLVLGGLVSNGPEWLAATMPVFFLGLGTAVIARALMRIDLPVGTATIFAILVFGGVIVGAPARTQAVFWPIGALVYVAPAVVALAALLVAACGTTRRESLFAMILGFIAAAGNETQAIVIPIALGYVAFSRIRRGPATTGRRRIRYLLPTASAAIGSVVLVAAPGNQGRSAMVGGVRHDPAVLLQSAWETATVLLVHLLASGLVPLLGISAIGTLFSSAEATRHPSAILTLKRVSRASLGLFVLAAATFCGVSAWGFNASAHPRAMFPVWLPLALAGFSHSAAVSSTRALSPSRRRQNSSERVRRSADARPVVVVGALCVPLFFVVSVGQVLPRDRALARQLDCVTNSVRAAGPRGVTVVAPNTVDGMLILENSPDADSNRTLAEVFGSGPVDRVGRVQVGRFRVGNRSETASTERCQEEAETLRRYVPGSDFGDS